MAEESIEKHTTGCTTNFFRQYARRYILRFISGMLMTSKSSATMHIRWIPLLFDLESCQSYSWGSMVLAWTYHSLCMAINCEVGDLAGCIPFLLSWIYHRFSHWCHPNRDTSFFLATRYGFDFKLFGIS
ncbi:hypothetical protein AHAS_Ahas16G0130000 [Arachis hypogaea]